MFSLKHIYQQTVVTVCFHSTSRHFLSTEFQWVCPSCWVNLWVTVCDKILQNSINFAWSFRPWNTLERLTDLHSYCPNLHEEAILVLTVSFHTPPVYSFLLISYQFKDLKKLFCCEFPKIRFLRTCHNQHELGSASLDTDFWIRYIYWNLIHFISWILLDLAFILSHYRGYFGFRYKNLKNRIQRVLDWIQVLKIVSVWSGIGYKFQKFNKFWNSYLFWTLQSKVHSSLQQFVPSTGFGSSMWIHFRKVVSTSIGHRFII